jgi:hypothetical protein
MLDEGVVRLGGEIVSLALPAGSSHDGGAPVLKGGDDTCAAKLQNLRVLKIGHDLTVLKEDMTLRGNRLAVKLPLGLHRYAEPAAVPVRLREELQQFCGFAGNAFNF